VVSNSNSNYRMVEEEEEEEARRLNSQYSIEKIGRM
jgi:hypothetical protein